MMRAAKTMKNKDDCQCLDCAESKNQNEPPKTRSCSIMFCVTQHCNSCRHRMLHCKYYESEEAAERRKKKEKDSKKGHK